MPFMWQVYKQHEAHPFKDNKNRCLKEGGALLDNEGFHHNENHLDFLERQLNEKYNTAKHLLLWNRKTGKIIDADDEGKLECLKCGGTWRWKDRVCNLPRTKCIANLQIPSHRRIRRKQPVSQVFANASSASSSGLPRVGVGGLSSGMESSCRERYYSFKHQLFGPPGL